mmetsp:Transcript_6805/g.7276  ORF Transcript_6805/g.7276 Transcript_6805/m.7276 type:complete len:119 (+) Transcript_6805:1152-1508(+)
MGGHPRSPCAPPAGVGGPGGICGPRLANLRVPAGGSGAGLRDDLPGDPFFVCATVSDVRRPAHTHPGMWHATGHLQRPVQLHPASEVISTNHRGADFEQHRPGDGAGRLCNRPKDTTQ